MESGWGSLQGCGESHREPRRRGLSGRGASPRMPLIGAFLRVSLGLAHSSTWLTIHVPPQGNCSEDPGPTAQEVGNTTQACTGTKGKEGARRESAAYSQSPLLAPGPEHPLKGMVSRGCQHQRNCWEGLGRSHDKRHLG